MENMQKLKKYLSIIETVIPRGSKIVFLDYPLHLNVGDILILKGTEEFFKEMDIDVITRRSDCNSMHYVEVTAELPEDVIVVIQGGGNFGDLYPAHQRLCEAVVKKFVKNKIVILPKTVHFEKNENLINSAEILKKHTNLTIFCRDVNSLDLLKKHVGDNIILCPDMAQFLWNIFPQQKSENVKVDLLLMIRRDIEKMKIANTLNDFSSIKSVDWEDICTDFDRKCMKISHFMEKMNRNIPGNVFPTNYFWYWHTNRLVKRVNKYFLSHGLVITSRMHGHILCCLLAVPNRLIDNSYGKNSGYYESWTKSTTACELIS